MRAFTFVAAVLLTHFVGFEYTSLASDATRPNVILVMADDMGWGDPSYQGNKVLKTPNLDAMAANGLRMNRFYAAAPVCSPTRGSCLTGRHPYRYGIFFANRGHMLPEEITLAEVLKDNGYATGHFGKWHLGTLTKTVKESNRGGPKGAAHFSPPSQNGFDENFSTEAKVPTWDPMLRPNTAKGNTWWDPVDNESDANAYGTHYWSNGKMVSENLRGDDSRVIMDRAIPFVEKHAQANKPFFAVIWFHAPHLPVVAGSEYTRTYKDHDKHSQHYFGCIAALDEQVGRLRDTLRRCEIADSTMLWFCSDNGPEGSNKSPGSAGGLRGRKRSLYDGGIRVPGILEWPSRVKAGSVTDIPTCTSDYLPTILAVLAVSMPDGRPLDGVNLKPLIDGEMKSRPKPIAFESGNQLALIDNRYKLVGKTDSAAKKKQDKRERKNHSGWQLFDITKDSGETNDIAAQHPDAVESMRRELLQWRESCNRSRQEPGS